MEKSRSMAGIVGPALIVITAAELKVWNPTLYDHQIAPLVYLSGVLLFVAGIAIVRSHNLWVLAWPVLITLTGWAGIALGLLRAFFPQASLEHFDNGAWAMGIEMMLIGTGLFLTLKAYWPVGRSR